MMGHISHMAFARAMSSICSEKKSPVTAPCVSPRHIETGLVDHLVEHLVAEHLALPLSSLVVLEVRQNKARQYKKATGISRRPLGLSEER
jgi:hypothetical protein